MSFVSAAVSSWLAILLYLLSKNNCVMGSGSSSIILSDVVHGEPGGPSKTAVGFSTRQDVSGGPV